MKSFIIKFSRDTTIDMVKKCLTSNCSYMSDVIVEAFEEKELKPLPEVKKIEMGVLMSPAERCESNHVDTITWVWRGESMQLCKDSSDIGKRLNINTSYYPRSFYRDIETTWDFNSIPVGSLVEVINNEDDRIAHGIYHNVAHGFINFGCVSWGTNRIKSIRIVELGESK